MSLVGSGINFLNIPFTGFLFLFNFISLMSCSCFTELYPRILRDNQVLVPLFFMRIVSLLSVMNRSNGDRFDFSFSFLDLDGNSINVVDLDSTKKYLHVLHLSVREVDFIRHFPLLRGRFNNNSDLQSRIDSLFSDFSNCVNIEEIIIIILHQFNFVVKGNPQSINSGPANMLYTWLFEVNQDTRVLGPRAYLFRENYVFYNVDLDFNMMYALLSALFIEGGVVKYMGIPPIVLSPGTSLGNCLKIEVIDTSTLLGHMTKVLGFFNVGSSPTSGSKKTNSYKKGSGSTSTNNKLKSRSMNTEIKRSYSSLSNTVSVRGLDYEVNFKDFYLIRKDADGNKVVKYTFCDMDQMKELLANNKDLFLI